MPVESSRRAHHLRIWQRRIVQWILLFSIAAAVSLVWSLIQPQETVVWTGTDGSASAATSPGSTINGKASASTSPGSTVDPSSSHPASGHASDRADGKSNATPDGKSTDSTVTTPRPSDSEEFPVYLVGAVQRPGVYIIRKGTYLYELVERAGGLTQEAASETINLAMRISENQMIRIPTRVEAEQNDSLTPVLGSGTAAPAGAININRATQADLEKLPGVGPATAAAIIADRNKNGPFRKPEDLMRVPGIKESRFVLMEALITVG